MIDRLVGAAAAANMPGLLPFALAVSSMLHYWSGSWSRATAAGSEAVDLSAVTGHAVGPSHVFAMFVAAGRGREDGCRTLADRAAEAIERTGDVGLRCWRHAALGRLELSLDRPAAAAELEAALAARPPGGVPDWTADLIEAYDRTGQPSRADELRGRLSHWAERNQDPLGRGLVAQALLRRVNGDELDEQYRRGVAELERASDHVACARLALEYGERLRREKRLTEARRPLGEAFGTFARLDAGPWSARALRELRACGGAPPPTKPDSLAALTPQELRVAFEVARGATNREAASRLVLSAKTVAFHLNNVYRKLGIRSRVELARVVAEAQMEGAAEQVGPTESAG